MLHRCPFESARPAGVAPTTFRSDETIAQSCERVASKSGRCPAAIFRSAKLLHDEFVGRHAWVQTATRRLDTAGTSNLLSRLSPRGVQTRGRVRGASPLAVRQQSCRADGRVQDQPCRESMATRLRVSRAPSHLRLPTPRNSQRLLSNQEAASVRLHSVASHGHSSAVQRIVHASSERPPANSPLHPTRRRALARRPSRLVLASSTVSRQLQFAPSELYRRSRQLPCRFGARA